MTTDVVTHTPVPEIETEEWIYSGQVTYKDKLFHRWIRPGGETVYFSKLAGHVIGGKYKISFVRNPDGDISTYHKGTDVAPRYIGRLEDDPRVVQWRTENETSNLNVARKRRERRAGADDPIREALLPIKLLMRGKARHERRAILAVVIDELLEGVWSD